MKPLTPKQFIAAINSARNRVELINLFKTQILAHSNDHYTTWLKADDKDPGVWLRVNAHWHKAFIDSPASIAYNEGTSRG